ncbi:unnamed protein product [Rotaria magnacalcarata]|uniref:Uncharacterized protein n=1 Tax=Rotaria magnacalcarata TaxID=392030 RepID=A0A8S2PB72_9BILA|nr:unnamed protein product [Rotaria magnacalcarata]
MESVSCTGRNETNDSFVDWTAFTSVDHRRYSFTFLNLTRLTQSTFTNFASTFPRNDLTIEFIFINGLDEIGENSFEELNYYSVEPIDLTFTSPRNFQLADYAFGRVGYFEIIIDSIQYSHIYNRPYRFNLKSMDGIKFYQMSIINFGEIYFVSNGSTNMELTQLTVKQRPICLLKDSIISEFNEQCADIDLFCELFSNGTTSPSFIEWTSLSPMNSSSTARFNSTTIVTTTIAQTSSTTLASSTFTIEQSSVSNVAITSIKVPLKKSNRNQQSEIILAITIPVSVIIISSSIVIYIFKRETMKNLDKSLEMQQTISHKIDEA